MATKYPCSRSLDEAPLVVPSSMRYYTNLPAILAIRNPTLLRDVVAALHHIDQQRGRRLKQVMGTK